MYYLAWQYDAKADIEFPRVHDEGVGRGCALRMRADNAVGWGYVEAPSGLVLAHREEIKRDGDVCEEVEGGIRMVPIGLDGHEVVVGGNGVVAGIFDGVVVDSALLYSSAERHADIDSEATAACHNVGGSDAGRQRKIRVEGAE